jgi:hypothetical protein
MELLKFRRPQNWCYGPWHKKFAWLPITTLTGRTVWLQSIYRRSYYFWPLGISGNEYITLFDLLKLQ